jgi:hypothetical protein
MAHGRPGPEWKSSACPSPHSARISGSYKRLMYRGRPCLRPLARSHDDATYLQQVYRYCLKACRLLPLSLQIIGSLLRGDAPRNRQPSLRRYEACRKPERKATLARTLPKPYTCARRAQRYQKGPSTSGTNQTRWLQVFARRTQSIPSRGAKTPLSKSWFHADDTGTSLVGLQGI